MALPDVSGPDRTTAIIMCENAVLLLRHLGHRGVYYVLPGGWVKNGETPEVACVRGALEELKKAVRELAPQLEASLQEDLMAIAVARRVGREVWYGDRGNHYFVATGNGESILAGPRYRPPVDPATRFGVWMPFEWVPLTALSNTNLQPPEAIEVCLRAAAGSTFLPTSH